jgi:benzoylformate decarboxylase
MNSDNYSFKAIDTVKPRRGAEVLLEVLHSQGVKYIFGNPGTTELPLIDALSSKQDISYILGLQEASVVAMADGYARSSGRPGFVNLHTAGGLGNAIGALINSQTSQTPLIVTAGQQDTRHKVLDPLLSGNLVDIARPITKWAEELVHPEHIPMLIRRAFNDCNAAPAGPVFLSLPVNVMEQETSVEIGEASYTSHTSTAGSLDILAEQLKSFEPGRLAIIAGDEVFTSRASDELVKLAEVLGCKVFGSSWPAFIPFPTTHYLWSGCLVPKASEIRHQLAEFEAVFILGGNSTVTYQYSEGSPIPQTCRVFQISSYVGNLGRAYPTTFSCVGDIKASLASLLTFIKGQPPDFQKCLIKQRHNLEKTRAAKLDTLNAQLDIEMTLPQITPFVAAAEVMKAVGTSTPIVDESPATMQHVQSFLKSPSGRQYYFMRSAILGWGMPAAVGISLGLEREPVVALIGDGSALYSPQALWTAAHEKIPVTFIITNNREYNILKNYVRDQDHYITKASNQYIGMDINDPSVDFLALATALGIKAKRIERVTEIANAVEEGITSGIPNLIEIPIGTV